MNEALRNLSFYNQNGAKEFQEWQKLTEKWLSVWRGNEKKEWKLFVHILFMPMKQMLYHLYSFGNILMSLDVGAYFFITFSLEWLRIF